MVACIVVIADLSGRISRERSYEISDTNVDRWHASWATVNDRESNFSHLLNLLTFTLRFYLMIMISQVPETLFCWRAIGIDPKPLIKVTCKHGWWELRIKAKISFSRCLSCCETRQTNRLTHKSSKNDSANWKIKQSFVPLLIKPIFFASLVVVVSCAIASKRSANRANTRSHTKSNKTQLN